MPDIVTETKNYKGNWFELRHELWDKGYGEQGEEFRLFWKDGYELLRLDRDDAQEILNLLQEAIE